jgi:hypothetical protein
MQGIEHTSPVTLSFCRRVTLLLIAWVVQGYIALTLYFFYYKGAIL